VSEKRLKELDMNPEFRVEPLENRQMLSVAAPVVAEVQSLVQPAITVKVAQPKLVANTYFLGSPTLGGISGRLVLKITTVSGTAVTAVLYSTNWGGFTVGVAGTINSAGAILLTGMSSTCQVTAFKGTLDSTNKVISGSCTIVQMGLALKGTITETRTSTAPILTTPTYPSLLGTYNGTSSDGIHPTLSITKQAGGLLWGKAVSGDAVVVTGFQSAPGVSRLHAVESDGYTNITGTRRSDGSLNGTANWYGNDGGKKTSTFVMTKV
jgi:hypothetical protein